MTKMALRSVRQSWTKHPNRDGAAGPLTRMARNQVLTGRQAAEPGLTKVEKAQYVPLSATSIRFSRLRGTRREGAGGPADGGWLVPCLQGWRGRPPSPGSAGIYRLNSGRP